jgi:hypothetical protein
MNMARGDERVICEKLPIGCAAQFSQDMVQVETFVSKIRHAVAAG